MNEQRQDFEETIRELRQRLGRVTAEASNWRDYALALELQMRREGWTDDDFEELKIERKK